MTRKEPSGEAVLAARVQRAYPSLNPWQCASLAVELCAIERAQRRHAERCCNGEDGGYVKRRSVAAQYFGQCTTIVTEHDPVAEERAGKRIERAIRQWTIFAGELCLRADNTDPATFGAQLCTERANVGIVLQGDPRGAVLLVQFPGETEARSV